MPHQKIRRKRQQKGLTQHEMAEKIGLTPSAYSKIERGETRIDIDRIRQIAKALETEVMDFFEDETIIVTHGDSNNSDSATGVIIHSPYNTSCESRKEMVEHLKEEITTLREENKRLLSLVEKFSGQLLSQ